MNERVKCTFRTKIQSKKTSLQTYIIVFDKKINHLHFLRAMKTKRIMTTDDTKR